jgi:DNA-binding HxlR family transcriptional regulator
MEKGLIMEDKSVNVIDVQKDFFKWHCLEQKDITNCIDECRVQMVLNLFGKNYLMLIIKILLIHKKMRFNEILEKIGGSPKTITSRLRTLEKYGLVNRSVFKEIPIKVEYSLTDQGKALEDIFERLSEWAQQLKIN